MVASGGKNTAVAIHPRTPHVPRWGDRYRADPHRRSVENIVLACRLVQAIAYCEAQFPAASSIDCVRWLDFMTLQRHVRGAIAMQSLWRMFRSITALERTSHLSQLERVLLENVRRSVRLQQAKRHATVYSAPTLQEAILRVGPVYASNPLSDMVARGVRHASHMFPSTPMQSADLPFAGRSRASSSPLASQSEFHLHPDLQRLRVSSQPWAAMPPVGVGRYAGVDDSSALSRPASPNLGEPPSSVMPNRRVVEHPSSSSSSSRTASTSTTSTDASRDSMDHSGAEETIHSPFRPPSSTSPSSPGARSIHTHIPDATSSLPLLQAADQRHREAPRPPSETRMPGFAGDDDANRTTLGSSHS